MWCSFSRDTFASPGLRPPPHGGGGYHEDKRLFFPIGTDADVESVETGNFFQKVSPSSKGWPKAGGGYSNAIIRFIRQFYQRKVGCALTNDLFRIPT